MIIVNTDYISGKNLETIGLVQGTMSKANILEEILLPALKGL